MLFEPLSPLSPGYRQQAEAQRVQPLAKVMGQAVNLGPSDTGPLLCLFVTEAPGKDLKGKWHYVCDLKDEGDVKLLKGPSVVPCF